MCDLPQTAFLDGRGVTICMHVRGFQATTSSMVADLPDDPERPARVWAALASPCASVYVPFVVPPLSYPGPAPLPHVLSDEMSATRFSALRQEVEDTTGALAACVPGSTTSRRPCGPKPTASVTTSRPGSHLQAELPIGPSQP